MSNVKSIRNRRPNILPTSQYVGTALKHRVLPPLSVPSSSTYAGPTLNQHCFNVSYLLGSLCVGGGLLPFHFYMTTDMDCKTKDVQERLSGSVLLIDGICWLFRMRLDDCLCRVGCMWCSHAEWWRGVPLNDRVLLRHCQWRRAQRTTNETSCLLSHVHPPPLSTSLRHIQHLYHPSCVLSILVYGLCFPDICCHNGVRVAQKLAVDNMLCILNNKNIGK